MTTINDEPGTPTTSRAPPERRAARWRLGVRGAAAWACIIVAVICAGLWLAGLFVSVGRFYVTDDTSLRFRQGVVDLENTYDHDFAPPVPAGEWHQAAATNGWVAPRLPSTAVPTFWYSGGGHVVGLGDVKHIRPARYRVLRVPLWALMLPGMIVAVAWVMEWRRNRRGGRLGFPVEAAPPLARAVSSGE